MLKLSYRWKSGNLEEGDIRLEVINKLNTLDVSIIIVNYNTAQHVKECIESILLYSNGYEHEIIVVDNFSTNKDLYKVEKIFPFVKFIYNSSNVGFGSGCNLGFSKSTGKYLLFLNPDTTQKSNVIKEFFEILEKDETIGICSTLLEDMNGNLLYCFNNFPNIKWEFLELTGFLANKKINLLLNGINQNQEYTEIDWAIGACLFIRRSVFEKAKGFDENFFLYYEDTDLQKRIKNEGFKIILLNRFSIKHLGKSSIEKSEFGDNIYHLNMHISKLKYFRKHHRKFYVFMVTIVNLLAFSLRLLVLPLRNQTKEVKRIRKEIIIKILKIYLGNYVE